MVAPGTAQQDVRRQAQEAGGTPDFRRPAPAEDPVSGIRQRAHRSQIIKNQAAAVAKAKADAVRREEVNRANALGYTPRRGEGLVRGEVTDPRYYDFPRLSQIEIMLEGGILPDEMTPGEAGAAGVRPEVLEEFYILNEFGTWTLRADEPYPTEQGYGGGGYPAYGYGGGWGGGGGSGSGERDMTDPTYAKLSPFSGGLTTWSIR